MASLVIVDQRDGTADVTIDGTGGGSWTLSTAHWDGFQGPAAGWQVAASGTGDGLQAAVTPPQGTGPTWWPLDVGGVQEVPNYAPLRNPNQCPWERSVRAVALGIEALALDGLPAGAVKIRQSPYRVSGDTLPLVIVCPYPAEVLLSKLNARDDVGYPVTVFFFDGANGALDKNLSQWLNWRWRVASLLRESRIETGQTGVYRVLWKPDLPVSVAALKQDFQIGAMMFECHSREPRGAI